MAASIAELLNPELLPPVKLFGSARNLRARSSVSSDEAAWEGDLDPAD
jgi:hypothetical protein